MAEATLAFNILTRYRDTGADKAARDMDNLGRSGSKMGGALKSAAKVGFLALAAGAAVGAKALYGMTQGAIADQKAQAILAKTLKNAAGATDAQVAATERWITKQGIALGVTDDELRPALQRLTEATGDVGEAQKLASLAMDISAGTGKSLKTVSEALAKAQMGNVGALTRYGVQTRNAAGDTMSFDDVVKKASKTFAGQASASANTLEGKMGRLRLIFDEAKEAVGARLIPVLTRLATFLLDRVGPALVKAGRWAQEKVLPPLMQVGKWVADKLIPALRELGEKALEGARSAFQQVAKTVNDNREQLTKIWEVSKTVAAFILRKLGPVVGTILKNAFKVLGNMISTIIKVQARLVDMWETMAKVVIKVKDKVVAFKDGTVRAFKIVQAVVKTATAWVVDKVLWMAEKVLDGAVKAFGWAPKIGDKLRDARDAVARFREDVNAELNKVNDENVNVKVTANTKGVVSALKNFGGSVFAAGGPVTGGIPGKDSVHGLLMPGEHVLTTDEVKKAGGHDGVFALRRMLRRGEFGRNGDVPAFANGGPVFTHSTPNVSGLDGSVAALRHRGAAMLGERVERVLVRAAEGWLKKQAGRGSLTAGQVARGQAFARSQVGKPYVWGGVGPGGYDCSGFISAVLNAAQGRHPYSRRGTTGTMPWPGFSPGKGGFTVGWFTGSPGHMAGTIGGMGIESAGGVGVRIGGAATSVGSFPRVAHYDQGGFLQPGWTMAYNGTGRPERVTAPHQESNRPIVITLELDGKEIHRSLLKRKRDLRGGLGLE